jgi:hypothetical protein
LEEAARAIKSKYSSDAFGDTEAAIANAIRSNCVPVRGRKWSEMALERLDGQFTPNGSVVTILSQVVVRHNDYHSVEVDLQIIERYMLDNLVLPGIRLAEAYDSLPSKFDDSLVAETAAREYLDNLPPDAPVKTKAEFSEEINYGNHELYERCGNGKLTKRALNRVWQSAPASWRRPGARPRDRG